MHLLLLIQHHHYTLPFFKRSVNRLPDTNTIFIIGNNAVDHNFNVVNLIPIYLHLRGDVLNFTIHTYFGKSLFPDLLKQFAVMPLTPFHYRCQQNQFVCFKFLQDGVQNLIF